MTDPSFYYAIFKKFQAVAGGTVAPGFGHVNDDASSDLSGGFSLLHTQDQLGLYGHLGPHASDYTIDNNNTKLNSAQQPLNAMSNDPLQNPLFVMLKASLTPGGAPGPGPMYFVTMNNQEWPVMPPPGPGGVVTNGTWQGFNTNAPLLIDAFETWIKAGKIDDAPKNAPLTFAALTQAQLQLKPFPGLSVNNNWPLLFVASMPGDDGRRNGDHAMPVVPIDHVPPDFWASSQIFLTDNQGNTVFPQSLGSGEEYYVAAIIGNAGNWGAGRVFAGVPPHMFVQGDAFAFNTFLSPNVQLPSLSNLDPQSINQQYEQYFLAKETYDVAGFRFNVDKVFAGLKAAMTNAGFTPAQLGGLTIDDWLKGSHPCVKIRITAGENANTFQPQGNVPLTLDSNPRKDRRIAQHNLAPFEITVGGGAKKSAWKNFILAQAGDGPNELALRHALPAATFQLLLAFPKNTYDHYIKPTGTKAGGVLKGFEVLKTLPDGVSKPFPDAVILRQTAADAGIQVASHHTPRFLGAAIGLVWDPTKLKPLPWPPIISKAQPSTVSLSHATHDGAVVGGFTLQLYSKK